jgi:ribosomal-protein-alanine N-acetyltransferase
MVEIEGWSYILGDSSECWTIDQFKKLSGNVSICPPVVAVDEDGSIKGFLLYRLRDNAIEIVKLVVDPFHYREGVGTKMLDKVVGKLSSRRSRIVMKVSDQLTECHQFLKKNNFRCYKVRWNDYTVDQIYRDTYCFERKRNNE